MATISLKSSQPLFDGLSQYWAGLVDAYKMHRDYTRTLNELKQLSKRELADLGMGHSTAEALAFEAVYTKK
ncbi:MAG: DUF1127 domain-containing protein [Pseudomonadota bacterium]